MGYKDEDAQDIEEKIRFDCFKRGWNKAIEAAGKVAIMRGKPYADRVVANDIADQIKALKKREDK